VLSIVADAFTQAICKTLSTTYKNQVTPLLVSSNDSQGKGLNLLAPEEARQIAHELSAAQPLSGLVFIANVQNETGISLADVPSLLAGFFAVLKVLLQSSNKAFCLHLSQDQDDNPLAHILAEGILGILLCAKIEYQSMLFRSIKKGREADLESTFRLAFDTSLLTVDLAFDGKRLFANALAPQYLPYNEEPSLHLDADNVVLVSGGARGVTSFFARALASFRCKIILLGRSPYSPAGNHGDRQENDNQASREIATTLQELQLAGAIAEYVCCDITDSAKVSSVIDDISTRYGRIDGIVHGAGILKDGFMQILNIDDFQKVLATKYAGIVNLVEACSTNLRFVIGLSSIAAITGNVGQANYCCANRAMASYLSSLQARNVLLLTKTFWLPPIEGIGMAEDPDLKEIIKIKVGENAFLDIEEISALFQKELLIGPTREQGIIPVRQLPQLPSLLFLEGEPLPAHDWFDCSAFPMIDRIINVDLVHGTLQAERLFSPSRDLWLNDHKPFAWLSHPIVSAIMIVETFLETARLFCAHQQAQELRKIQFSRMFECPAEQVTPAHILCRTEKDGNSSTTCHISFGKLVAQEVEGKQAQQSTYFSGQVVMAHSLTRGEQQKFTSEISAKHFDAVMQREDILKYYQERSGLTGRYRILEKISGYSSQSIFGEMTYPETEDFAPQEKGRYQYPVYLLEGLLQIVSFHSGIRDRADNRALVPAAIDSIRVYRKCSVGEQLFLVGQLLNEDTNGITWNAQGYGDNEELVLQVDGLRMNRLE
jgi:short-subunit dehydrogenase involved in D-alanine esterification of teichoic acids